MATEEERAPLSKEVKRLEGEVGPHAHHPLVHFRVFEELKKRNVFRVAVLYVVVCWLILDPVHVIFHMADVPEWVNRLVLIVMAVGFPAVLIFAWVYEITPEGLKPTVEVPHSQSIRKLTGRRLDRAIIAVLAVALTYFVVDKFWISKRIAQPERSAATIAQASTAAAAVTERSIAVLPFLDMSEKHDQEYFADGMAEEILDILAKVPQLTVIGRTSSFQFKNRTEDLRTIGEKLRSAYVVEGSVRKAGERIRVTAQLIETHSGTHLWSESYDRDFGDVLNLQDEIATSIARALQLTIGARDARPLSNAQATEAYTLYLKGKLALDKFEVGSMLEAQNSFQQALALDPTLVAAAEGLALTYVTRGQNEEDISGREAWEKAREAAQQALRLDASSASAHGVLGFVAGALDYDWGTAEREFRKALALNPNDPGTLANSAEISGMHGDFQDAVQRANASLALDPFNANTYEILGIFLYLKGDYPGAEIALRKSLSINPEIDVAHLVIGYMHVVKGRREEALKEFAADPEVSVRDTGLALVNHALGKKAESDAALARVVSEVGKYWPYGVAFIHAYRGERDQAFEWLEKAYAGRDVDLEFLLGDPFLTSLHDDPRWSALMKKMNLAK